MHCLTFNLQTVNKKKKLEQHGLDHQTRVKLFESVCQRELNKEIRETKATGALGSSVAHL